MRDEFLGRDWAENHDVMSHGIDKLFVRLMRGFKRLSARRFDAPWKDDARPKATAP